MSKQGIKERSKQGENCGNQGNLQTRAPGRVRKRRNPVPNPQKPEALHAINESKKYR